ncbi:hypothetical protein ACF0H5_003869 [Mactra antiquata]
MKKINHYDKNQDGVICVNELGRLLQYLGFNPTDEEVKEYMKKIGKKKDEDLDFEQLYEFIQTLDDPSGELMEAFRLHDKNGDGYIDQQELKAIFTSGSFCPDDIDGLFELVDVNNDGKIDYKEFVALFTQNK